MPHSEMHTPLVSNNITVGTVVLDHGTSLAIWLPEVVEPARAEVSANLRLFDQQGRCVLKLDQAERIGPRRIKINLPANHNLIYWHVDNPFLYRLHGQIAAGSCTWSIDQPLGLRWFDTSRECVQLNGQPFYIRGCIRGITAHDHPNLTGLPDAQWHAYVIQQAKSLGFNFIRWHSTVPDESFLEQADQLGLAVQVELGFEKRDDELIVDTEAWERMIYRLCRHPSAAVYCVGNEIRRSGHIDIVQTLVKQARVLDPSVLSVDSCGWGEPDRVNTDIYIQHVAYFFPYGEHRRMFDRIDSFELEGYCHSPESRHPAKPIKPVIAHEVCHYIAMRDIGRFEEQWRQWRNKQQNLEGHPAAVLPKWVHNLKELYKLKGLGDDERELRLASEAFQRLAQKHSIESIRRSEALCGFQMLQLADCWKYENSNGLLNCFDEVKHWETEAFLSFNRDTVILSDLEDRVYFHNTPFPVSAHISHFGSKTMEPGQLTFRLEDEAGRVLDTITAPTGNIAPATTRSLATVEMRTTDSLSQACKGVINVTLDTPNGSWNNTWKIWLLPLALHKPDADSVTIKTLTPEDLRMIEQGARRLWLYRPSHLFDPNGTRPGLDFDGRRELFKPVIWDRGDNLGGVVRRHPAVNWLPNEGYIDWQFAPLMHHGCKINLDTFPVKIQPVVQGVDRPVRDRVHVIAQGNKSLQPELTCRKWGWLFDLAIGKGRLLVCGFNTTCNHPLGEYLKTELVRSLDHLPSHANATIERNVLENYLKERAGNAPPVEAPMTRYWLKNDELVEPKLFWEELNFDLV